MNLKMNTKNMVIAALLTALSIVIPLFSYTIILPPFTATIASHVPVMIAMFINPFTAVLTGVGSMIGFLIKLGDPVVTARAGMHIIFALIGALMYQRGMSVYLILLITMFIHGISEALIVLPFGWTLEKAGVTVGVGTMLHHIVDSVLTLGVYAALLRAGLIPKQFKKPVMG